MSLSPYATSSITQATGATGTTMLGAATTGTWLGQTLHVEGQHTFNCQKVENGWTLNYRNKQYIAADLDSLMEQMKTAMVIDRIDK